MSERGNGANVIWFRHGLRLHDNPALLEALADCHRGIALLPLFIFDGESAGTKCVGYNRMRFLLESLRDIDEQLRRCSVDRGCLYVVRGNPTAILRRLHQAIGLHKVCFEQDCEPIWRERDDAVRELCAQLGIDVVERVSHTLWDPQLVIETSGGIPPLTYQMFLHTVQVIGPPSRPALAPSWHGVTFVRLSSSLLLELNAFMQFPTVEDFNIFNENHDHLASVSWKGGEQQALLQLQERLTAEEAAFRRGYYLPNQAMPKLDDGMHSVSPHLRFGCLSVRRFYWSVHDLFIDVQRRACDSGTPIQMVGGPHLTGQLIWREYFYTMSVRNVRYDRIEGNDICLTIPWATPTAEQLDPWLTGRTGFPLIDAAMRQLLAEGWIHHTLRNIVATFLTRGGLWQSWEHGLRHFLKYLLDADWSVCAGNWMWVSSSAFEQLLDSSHVSCPLALAKRLDPDGDYIRRYVIELRRVPAAYIHEPWRMPADIQKESGCIIDEQYPRPMIDLHAAYKRNALKMQTLRNELSGGDDDADTIPPHCRPSSEEEIRQFFWLAN